MRRAVLDLEPFPAPRPRARAFEVKPGAWTASIYTPEAGPYRAWRKAALVLLTAAARGAPPLEGPLGLKVVLLFTMPKGEHRVRVSRPRRWHVAKPDADNVLKALMDAMKEAGWLRDDSQVCELVVQKLVARQGERPSIHATLYPMKDYVDELVPSLFHDAP